MRGRVFKSLLVSTVGICLLASACTPSSDSELSATPSPKSNAVSKPSSTAANLPLISEGLDCGVEKPLGGIAPGSGPNDLERYTIDTRLYPNAICNDGSAGVFYFRPAANPANDKKWVIQLQGGGGCNTAQTCANRWCSIGTSFSMTQMSSTNSPEKTPAVGIFARKSEDPSLPQENPIGDYNQVMIKYCSSDTWRGTLSDVSISTLNPDSGAEARFRIHFQGQGIYQAVLSLLKKTHGFSINHEGTGKTLSDLDEAEELIFAGASAGGAGVSFNLDSLTSTLKATNPNITVLGLIDSKFAPEGYDLDYSASTLCPDAQTCTAEEYGTYDYGLQQNFWRATQEASCETFHANDGEKWKCASDTHILLNHISTPFFVRQGLSDVIISEGLVDTDVRMPNGADYDQLNFRAQVRNHFLNDFPGMMTQSEEATTLTESPGGFAPICSKHETLRSTFDTHQVTITDNGTSYSMFDVWKNWRSKLPNSIVTHKNTSSSRCQ